MSSRQRLLTRLSVFAVNGVGSREGGEGGSDWEQTSSGETSSLSLQGDVGTEAVSLDAVRPILPSDGGIGSIVFYPFFSLLCSLMVPKMKAVTGTCFVTKRCPILYSQEVKVHTTALTLKKFPVWEGESAGD